MKYLKKQYEIERKSQPKLDRKSYRLLIDKIVRHQVTSEGQTSGSNLEYFKEKIYRKTIRDSEKVSIENIYEFFYGL